MSFVVPSRPQDFMVLLRLGFRFVRSGPCLLVLYRCLLILTSHCLPGRWVRGSLLVCGSALGGLGHRVLMRMQNGSCDDGSWGGGL